MTEGKNTAVASGVRRGGGYGVRWRGRRGGNAGERRFLQELARAPLGVSGQKEWVGKEYSTGQKTSLKAK